MLLLVGCSGGDDLAATEKAVDEFHAALNAGDFARIHDDAAGEWKKVSSKPDSIQLFEAVRNKLGPFVSGKQVGWNVNYGTSGTIVVVQYDSKFQRGDARETFTYRRLGDDAQLVGYNINSRVLITG
jgi:hypothetical protein